MELATEKAWQSALAGSAWQGSVIRKGYSGDIQSSEALREPKSSMYPHKGH